MANDRCGRTMMDAGLPFASAGAAMTERGPGLRYANVPGVDRRWMPEVDDIRAGTVRRVDGWSADA